MRLHSLSLGAKHPDKLVLLHGWGLNHAVWQNLHPLSESMHLLMLDLPGHGNSPDMTFTLDNLTQVLLQNIPKDSILLGWSMGGMLAQQLILQAPKHCQGMILINSTPQFANQGDWSHGLDVEDIQTFANGLMQDYHGTLKRFLILQALGESGPKQQSKRLQEAIVAGGLPRPSALQGGLEILLHCNLRPRLPQISIPCLIIHGDNDRLCSREAARYLQQNIKGGELEIMPNCAHAPFLSKPDWVMARIREFTAQVF